MTNNHPDLAREWATLQNNHERYETGGLVLKLAAVALFGVGVALGWSGLLLGLLVPVLWLQEGIYRTFQARLGTRILRVEALLRDEARGAPCQLHSEWLAGRPGLAGLLAEYGKSALRPTVAFPYALLLAAGLARHLAG